MTALPSFIIAGAAKSATTWLQQSLQASSGIFMPDPELHFFSRHYEPGLVSYRRHFADAPAGALLGEKSNSYLTTPNADVRIHRHLPEVRLVFQLRDPVARAYSDYCMLFRRGEVDDNVNRHLDPSRAAGERFLADGCYADHLERFIALFGAKPVLVLLYEDVRRDPERQLRLLAAHVGYSGALAPPLTKRVKDARAAAVPRPLRRLLGPLRPVLDPIRGTAPLRMLRSMVARPYRYPALDPVLRAEIADFYRPQIMRLAAMTGVDTSAWSEKNQVLSDS